MDLEDDIKAILKCVSDVVSKQINLLIKGVPQNMTVGE